MNTQQRIFLLRKFENHINQKIEKIQKQKHVNLQIIQNYNININTLPAIDILNDLTNYYEDINSTIVQTCESVQQVMGNLSLLKNRKQNTSRLQDVLASISMIKQYSITLKFDNYVSIQQLSKGIMNYYQIRDKQIDDEIDVIQIKYRRQFDNQLTKTNSQCIKDISRILQIIKLNKKKILRQKQLNNNNNQNQNNQMNNSNKIQDNNNKITFSQSHNNKQQKRDSINSTQSLSQISQFYVTMVKKQLTKFQQELFNIPIISSNPNQPSYLFFDIIKNTLKIIANIIKTYSTNIIKLQSISGLHQVIVHVFKYTMDNLVYQILVRQKKYFEIDKIIISRNKLTIKPSQYKVIKNYLKQFNAIWNQIQRFRTHLYHYIQDKDYKQKNIFNQQLIDIINTSKFVEFNYQIILYFQAFFRHQLDRLIKKNPFILSLWQLDDGFFKQVKQKNDFKSNLTGQQFIQEMIVKFTQGIKKSFETLNVLIVSALINFINHHLIYQDSFYAFNQLITRFINKISDSKSIQGIMILMNIVNAYPKAIKSAFQQLEIPEQLPIQRIKNQISQLILNCKQKTGQFIVETFDKILAEQWIVLKISSESNHYQQVINKLFVHFEKDLLNLFVYKMSKVHVQLILQQEFKQKYSHMDVLSLQKQIRSIINFYESKSHSIRQNFKKILDYIEVLLIQSESGLRKLIEQWKGKYDENELKGIWKLRTGN